MGEPEKLSPSNPNRSPAGAVRVLYRPRFIQETPVKTVGQVSSLSQTGHRQDAGATQWLTQNVGVLPSKSPLHRR